MSPKAVLVGLPGAGKSATGRRLAKILGVAFADSDELVEAAQGRPVTTIFAESGEAEFRSAETAVIITALAEFDGVLALGGGAVTTERVRDGLLDGGAPVVVLRANLGTLRARVGDARTRPLLADDPTGRLASLAEQRSPIYDSVSTFVIDTDDRTPGQVAATVAARLHDGGYL